MEDSYYDSIAEGYNELHAEEQLKKLELIGQEIHSDSKISDFISSHNSLLDVGCGTGISTGFFKCKSKTGIDPSKKLIEIAKTHYPTIIFKVESSESLSFKNNSFDLVISLTAIQNFTNIEKGLTEIKRVGKDRFILTFLKKSSKHELINDMIRKNFDVIKFLEEDKDYIYFCR